jgi:paraquat-inducible protein B
MSKKASPTAVGLFTLAGLALVVVGIVIFGSGRYFAETAKFVLYFDGSVKGLGLGADVKFRGVSIGSVTDVGVVFNAEDFSFAIPVHIEVDLDRFRTLDGAAPTQKLAKLRGRSSLFDLLIDRGLRAELKLESLLTGQLFIEIDFHPDTPVIHRARPGEVQELPTIQSKLALITKTIETIPFEHVVEKVTSSLEAIERLLNAPELGSSIRSLDQTLIETRGLVKDAREKLGGLSQEIGGAASGLRKSGEQLDKLLANLTEMTQGGDDLREEVTKALRELVDAARALRLLAETIEARPDVLLRGKGPATGGE